MSINFYHPSKIILKFEGKLKRMIKLPFKSIDYNYEAREVLNGLNVGKFKSEIMPLDETLDILRSQWGFTDPRE